MAKATYYKEDFNRNLNKYIYYIMDDDCNIINRLTGYKKPVEVDGLIEVFNEDSPLLFKYEVIKIGKGYAARGKKLECMQDFNLADGLNKSGYYGKMYR